MYINIYICICIFFESFGKRGDNRITCRTMCPGVLRPRKLTCRSALTARVLQLLQGAPGSHSQDTATGYTHTWPPASLNGQPTTARTLVPARSVKSTPLSNPEGPRRGCAAGQHTQHFGSFVPRCSDSPTT